MHIYQRWGLPMQMFFGLKLQAAGNAVLETELKMRLLFLCLRRIGRIYLLYLSYLYIVYIYIINSANMRGIPPLSAKRLRCVEFVGESWNQTTPSCAWVSELQPHLSKIPPAIWW